MAKTFPYIGEVIPSNDFPAPMRMMRVTVGSATTNDVVLSTQTTYDLFTVPAGCVISEVLSQVNTAFTASVTLTVGDSDDADGWSASATIAPQSTGGILVTGAGAYGAAKNYTAAQAVQIVVGAADVAAGQADLYFVYSMSGND